MTLAARLAGWAFNGVAGGLAGGLTLLALVLYNLYCRQESLLYYPTIPGLPFPHRTLGETPSPFNSPEPWGLPHEEVTITTADGVRLSAWFMRSAGGPASPTIVFCHANAGHMGFRLPNFAALVRGVPANVLAFDYRGYGNSEGSPTEAGLSLDIDAVLQHVAGRPDVDPRRVFLFGRSLGGAVAVRGAASLLRPDAALAGIILENTFTSISDMVDVVMPWLSPFKAWVLRMHWPTGELLPRLPGGIPLLLISGERDALVPPAQMRALAAAAERRPPPPGGAPLAPTTLWVVPGAGHDDCAVAGGAAYLATIRRFMDAALKSRCGGEGLAAAGPPQPVIVPEGVPARMVPGAAAAGGGGEGGEEAPPAAGGPVGGPPRSFAGVGVPVPLDLAPGDADGTAAPLRDDGHGHAVPVARGAGEEEL